MLVESGLQENLSCLRTVKPEGSWVSKSRVIAE